MLNKKLTYKLFNLDNNKYTYCTSWFIYMKWVNIFYQNIIIINLKNKNNSIHYFETLNLIMYIKVNSVLLIVINLLIFFMQHNWSFVLKKKLFSYEKY